MLLVIQRLGLSFNVGHSVVFSGAKFVRFVETSLASLREVLKSKLVRVRLRVLVRSRGAMRQMIEKNFDISFIADLALREKQIQQNYRPVIAVHKWFARRPGTLFRSLLLSEFTGGAQREVFYQSHNLAGKRMADPFMGGGTPLLEANRLGCNVLGYDINPMSHWIVREEIESIDLVGVQKGSGENL